MEIANRNRKACPPVFGITCLTRAKRALHRNDRPQKRLRGATCNGVNNDNIESRGRGDPCVRARQPRTGAATLQPAIARSEFYQTPLPEPGTGTSIWWQYHVRPLRIRPTGRTYQDRNWREVTPWTITAASAGDVAAGVVVGAVGRRCHRHLPIGGQRHLHDATVLSVSPARFRGEDGRRHPAVGSANRVRKGAGKAHLLHAGARKRFCWVWALCDQVIRAAEIGPSGGYSPPRRRFNRRVSSG